MQTIRHNKDWMKIAEIELVYKTVIKASDRPVINASHDSFELLKEFWNFDKIDFVEQFKILLLNRRNRVLGLIEISSGGVSGTIADIKLIFSAALKANATSIILTHNHPSGDARPSKADIQMTERIKMAGQLLDIAVTDHIIVTSEGYFSFADEMIL